MLATPSQNFSKYGASTNKTIEPIQPLLGNRGSSLSKQTQTSLFPGTSCFSYSGGTLRPSQASQEMQCVQHVLDLDLDLLSSQNNLNLLM